jgi:hypothetical protein
MFETWYKMAALIQSGLDLSPIITHRFGIDDFQKGFDAMRSGQSGKVFSELGLIPGWHFKKAPAGAFLDCPTFLILNLLAQFLNRFSPIRLYSVFTMV